MLAFVLLFGLTKSLAAEALVTIALSHKWSEAQVCLGQDLLVLQQDSGYYDHEAGIQQGQDAYSPVHRQCVTQKETVLSPRSVPDRLATRGEHKNYHSIASDINPTYRDNINIVLVHGIWFDASSWSKVIPILQNAGHRVIAVHLSLHSLTDDVSTVKRAIGPLGGPTIFVGHAYGGFVMTNL
jgi:pimeloyl-ACP methyl ester carboxylesterase